MEPSEKKILFEKAYKEHLYKVRHFSYGYVNDWEAAKEISQDVFVRFWDTMEKLDFTDSVLPYLIAIARNVCLNYLKHARIVGEHSIRTRKMAIEESALAHPGISHLYTKEVSSIISQTIETLSPKVKSTFIKSRFENLTYNEIAQIENISVKSVEYRIMEALKILRRNLKDYMIFILFLG